MKPTITPPPLLNQHGFRITLVDESANPYIYWQWFDLYDLHRSRATFDGVFGLFTGWVREKEPNPRKAVVKIEINVHDAHFNLPLDFLHLVLQRHWELRVCINE